MFSTNSWFLNFSKQTCSNSINFCTFFYKMSDKSYLRGLEFTNTAKPSICRSRCETDDYT